MIIRCTWNNTQVRTERLHQVLKMVMFCLFVLLQLKEFENQNRSTCSSDAAAEWMGPSSPTHSELLNNNNTVSLPPTHHFPLQAGKTSPRRRPLGRSSDGAAVPPLNRGPPPKPCSSGPSPSCGATGPLLFIAVKALTLHCDALSGWIQLRPLLCRPQLFCCMCGVIRGGSGLGHIFQICLDGPECFSLLCVFCVSRNLLFSGVAQL